MAPPPVPDSPIAAQPGIHSRQTAFEGRSPELGGGQGQPGEAAAGPLGLYQNRPRRGGVCPGPYHQVPGEGVGSVNSVAALHSGERV